MKTAISFPSLRSIPRTLEDAVLRQRRAAGRCREGKLVTSRQLKERLFRELKTNVSIYIEDTDKAGVFNVKARGAMQIAVLVETMRREGFELLVSRPTVMREGGRRPAPGTLRDRLDRGAG